MTLPASGPLSLNDIQGEFGGTNPIGMNEYYAGGGLVPPGTTGTYGAVPSSGALSVQNFYGTSNYIPVYIEELFQTWLYSGTGATQTITNGINLSGNGGMVWVKQRTSVPVNTDHYVTDSARGPTNTLSTNTIDAQVTGAANMSYQSTGFTLLQTGANSNGSGANYVSWTFREQPKFFDVVTYTGNGSTSQVISHALGSVPGCVIIKRTNSTSDWYVYHRGNEFAPSEGLALNESATTSSAYRALLDVPTSTTFTAYIANTNTSGATYVAYLFAHNAGGFGLTGTDNVISCGSYTGSYSAGNPGPTVTLGFEPQFLMIKSVLNSHDWTIMDNMRGMPVNGPTGSLNPNNNTRDDYNNNRVSPTATGFIVDPAGQGIFQVNQNGRPYIYIAIRRGPMKVPTTGTSVYQPVTYAGNDANRVITAGFPVDMAIFGLRDTATSGKMAVTDRLRGRNQLLTTQTSAEGTATGLQTNPWDLMTGVKVSGDSGVTNFTPWQYIDWNFRRAPSFFDEVCYTGNGPGTQVVNHNLTVVPELVINKVRSTTSGWTVFQGSTTALTGFLRLNETNGQGGDTLNVSATTITVDSTIGFGMNTSGATYVTYLFATCPGVSKVGRYTGTGTTQVINCGFSAGSRFVMIKRFNSTGPWYVWDSARGIVAGNDPYLLLNSIADEVTNTDFVDTAATGFEISSTAPAEINASGSTFIFLAIA